MKVFVTGADGMVGRALVPLLRKRWDVRSTDLPELDVTDAPRVGDAVAAFGPDVIIHLASITDVDACERDPEAARLVNAGGTANVAAACRKCGATMLYLSTGMIYNGRKSAPYIEYDAPDPVNAYGRSKYEGELAVRAALEKYYIFNTCWIFGGGSADRKFVARIIELARSRATLRVVDDTYGSPTYTMDLAGAIDRFLREARSEADYGRYHCVGRGCVNRFELAGEILAAAGIGGCRLEPASSSEFDLPAPRPRMEAMANYSLDLLGFRPMRDWREALREYIASAGF
ncbi:MAG: dTDP-4-dehydrorhamnose reductase [Candidatus Krumholzibacteria bacterium]|nr:dTDP-4-dehydrorhamnose reductase [Candidatus Krumholzibacteria bacterium]